MNTNIVQKSWTDFMIDLGYLIGDDNMIYISGQEKIKFDLISMAYELLCFLPAEQVARELDNLIKESINKE